MPTNKTPVVLFLFIVFSAVSLANARQTFGLTDHVVISQIQISGATAGDEFVELYNPTQETINLTGYRLSKKVASGTQSNLIASMSGSISPNSYFLIQSPNYTQTVQADAEYSTSSTVTSDNVVILYSDAGTTVKDKVGFGTPFESETLSFPTNPSANQSIRRISNQDTDNNSIDFELLNVSDPRNSATASGVPAPTETPTPTTESTQPPESTSTPITTPTPETTNSPTPPVTPSPEAGTPLPTNTPTPYPSVTPLATPSPKPPKVPKPHKDYDKHNYWTKYHSKAFDFESRQIKCGKYNFGKLGINFFRR